MDSVWTAACALHFLAKKNFFSPKGCQSVIFDAPMTNSSPTYYREPSSMGLKMELDCSSRRGVEEMEEWRPLRLRLFLHLLKLGYKEIEAGEKSKET